MNKITFLLFAILFSVTLSAQDSPGMRPQLLLNKTVKIKPIPDGVLFYEKGYDAFFIDEVMTRRYAETRDRRTDYNTLAERFFKVVAVVPVENAAGKNVRVKLLDTVNSETIYYRFNKLSETQGKYYFQVIGGLKYPADFYCDFVKTENNKEAGEQKTKASIIEGLHIIKITKGKTTTYKMEAGTVESTISMVRGVTLILENGLKLEKPDVEVTMAAKNDNIVYNASFDLTPADLALLSQSPVVSGKISKFEKKYSEGPKWLGMLKCMRSK